jgi:hypothetical protein
MPANEGFNGLAQLILAFEAGALESFPLEQAEHNLNLVEPTGRSRSEVKLDAALKQDAPVHPRGACFPAIARIQLTKSSCHRGDTKTLSRRMGQRTASSGVATPKRWPLPSSDDHLPQQK